MGRPLHFVRFSIVLFVLVAMDNLEIKYFQLSSDAEAHSGGLNSRGCHGGSRPYHCHRSPSEMVGNRLRCDLGSRSKECDKKPPEPGTPRKAPKNGYVYGNDWYCNDGFRKNYATRSCEPKF